ncbi:MAG TPA: hypothetical protein VNP95_13790 [Thermomicrobiales bacterium]|nr:hypothetical protein [Thermomicrobiales bacterium]
MSREKPAWLGHTVDHKSIETLLNQDHYTPDELAELTGINVRVIENAVFEKELDAIVVEHDIISISRHDALEWLRATTTSPAS